MPLKFDHRSRILSLFLFLFFLSNCATFTLSKDKPAAIAVTVYHNERLFPGATLYLVRDIEKFPADFAYAAKTNKDGKGVFSDVRSGVYFLLAKGVYKDEENEENEAFGYFGGNPLYVNDGDSLDLVLPVVDYRGTQGKEKGEDILITGSVEFDGKGLEECFIFAYTDSSSYFRDPSEAIMGKSDDSGYFEIEVSPGKYYLVARKRKSGLFAGPLEKGDYFGYYPGNPVVIDEGEKVKVAFPVIELKMRNDPVYRKRGIATITGKIIDESGNAVAGAYAALYENPELLNRPLYVSMKSAEDGKFVINVPLPGVYYLGARTGYGGPPGPGDLYGRYEETLDHSIEVEPGDTIAGIVIVVSEVW